MRCPASATALRLALAPDYELARGESTNMVPKDIATGIDPEHLRRETLRSALACVAVGLYVWCVVLYQLGTRYTPTWRGPLLLGCGVVAAFLLRDRRPKAAALALILGLLAANLYAIYMGDMKVAPYLLAVPVSLTGLLLGLELVLWATLLCSSMVIVVGTFVLGYPVLAPDLLAPALVVGAVGVLSTLSVRNLYLALYWAWDRAVAAQRNQEELRDRRAELARTAKALDEACQRLEYMNYDLAQARDAAEEARLLKQQLVSSVSHELRTPLNVIVAFSEMMYLSPQSYGGVPLPADYRGDVREIYRSSQHLLHLVDDVLDLSQAEARHLRVHMEPSDLAQEIAEAVDIMRPLVRGKDVELRVDLPLELPLALMDPPRIRQVLLNLLNNARRFTHHGNITVRATVEPEWLRVTVADTGIGIPPSQHDSVFEEFTQLENPVKHSRGGTGLGLAISRRLVELHGGRIWVESEGIPGQGSAFHFTLPLAAHARTRPEELLRSPVELLPPQGRGRILLVLSKDASVVHLLEHELDEYNVLPAVDAHAVATLVTETHPRAIVINAAEGRYAWRQARQVRRLFGPSGPPIVLCPLVTERQLACELGALDYLIKPVSRTAVTTLLNHLGEAVHRILIVDDDPRMTRMLSRMLQAAGDYEVLRVHSGQQALHDMRRTRPDLVLLDLVMPEIDGRQVLAEMRRDEELRSTKVVVVTAQPHTPEDERRLSGGILAMASSQGLSNREALACLHRLLDSIGLRSSSLVGEGRES